MGREASGGATRRGASRPSREVRAEEKKQRTGGRHCPVCLELLPSLGGRAAGSCPACGGQPAPGRRCSKCGDGQLWEAGANAGCAACGHHGSKVKVLAGHEWLRDR